MRFFTYRAVIVALMMSCTSLALAQTGLLKGQVINDANNLPAADVPVAIPYLKLVTYTDGAGDFTLSQLPYGTHNLVIGGGYFRSDTLRITIDKDVVFIGSLKTHYNDANTSITSVQIPAIALEDNDVSGGDDGASTATTSGLLTASRDPFTNTAAFTFGPYRFQPRSYERNTQQVLINGATMNDIETGDAYWSQWGGLNDVFRNRSNIYGLQPSEYAFGSILGSVFFDITAANQRKQTRITYSNSNRQYRHRLMLTHSSGINKKGWAYSFSVSRRYAKEGYIPGTFYDGYSYYASVSKVLGKGMLSLTTFGAPTKRGKMAPSIQEAYDILGTNYYNPNWGLMNGEVKNAKVHNSYQPVYMLNYDYNPSNRTKWNTVLTYQTGKLKNSTMDWFNAWNPRPDYYRYFPSYYLLNDPADPVQAEKQREYFKNNSQINWDEMVQGNYANWVQRKDANGNYTGQMGRQSLFVIGNDVDDINKWVFNTNINQTVNEHTTVQGGVTFIKQRTESYRELDDLLGGDFYVNQNQFAQLGTTQGISTANDINNPNQEIKEGDKYFYHYVNNFQKTIAWAQADLTFNKIDFYLSAFAGNNSFDRDGKFRNGLFPNGNQSYGKSEKMSFFLFGAKGGVTYKLNGRNFLFVNALYQTDAPTVDNTYISPRTRNFTVPNPTTQKTTSIEGGFLHRSPKANARLVGYSTDVKDITEIKRFYNESSGANSFVNYLLYNMNVRYAGIEAALEYRWHSTFSTTLVLAKGQAYYTNNPGTSMYLDNFVDTLNNGAFAGSEKVYVKNYFLATGPQTAATLGLNYRSPKFWYANINFNYFDNNYVDIAPNRRTENAAGLLDRNSAAFKSIFDQEKLPSAFTVDLFAGKSFLLSKTFKQLPRNTYLYLNLGVNNLLNNKNIRTGGFEQLRFDDQGVAQKFPSKYFYAYGANYFVNISLKF